MKIVYLLKIFGVVLNASIAFGTFKKNDVSILYPIPTISFSKYFAGLDDQEKHGPLLTRRQFEIISQDLQSRGLRPQDFLGYSNWKIVSIRLDPCPLGETMDCLPEVRLVAQPHLNNNFKNNALHLVYEVTKTSFQDFISRQQKLNTKYGLSQPNFITFHQGFQKGLRSPFHNDFEALLLENIGENKLSRVSVDGFKYRGMELNRV